MRIGLTFRTLDGVLRELTIVDGHFRGAGEAVDIEIDASEMWAVPGLADCHAHLSGADPHSVQDDIELSMLQANAWAQLENGVYLVADKGSKDSISLRILDEPPPSRPELHMAGRVIANSGGYFEGFAREVDERELMEEVRRATGGGATWVKLIGDWPRPGQGAVTNFSEAAMHQAVQVAHAAGRRVAIHACAPETSSLAVAAGIDSIEHGLFITDDDLVALGARGGAWVPTISAMESIRDMLGAESSGGRLFDEGLHNVRERLAAAPDLGVAVLAGTDLEVPHGGIAIEAASLHRYGLSAEQVVHATTKAAYDYLGSTHTFDVGGHADIVLFENDPRGDVAELGRPALGLRHGSVTVGSLDDLR